MMSPRKKIAYAVVGSLLLHVVLLFFAALAAQYWPSAPLTAAPAEPIRLEVVREEPTPSRPKTEVPPGQPAPYIPTLDRQRSDHPPDEAVFQSDKDTLAASEQPARDPSSPLPSQEGKESTFFAFDTNPYVAGPKAADDAGLGPASPPEPPPPPPDVSRRETSPPRPQPNPAAAVAEASPTPPVPAETPPPTPPPDKEVAGAPTPSPTPDSMEFAMLAPQPTPLPEPSPPPAPTVRRPPPRPAAARQPAATPPPAAVPVARALPPRPAVPRPGSPGYRPQTVRPHINGGISTRGPSAVAARGTALGRYEKALSDAIGSRWYYYAEQRAGLIPISTVRINFVVEPEGKVRDIRVVEGEVNGSLATMSIEALVDASIPPIPDEVVSALPDGRMDVTFSFAQF